MLDWVLNTALPLQTLFHRLVSLNYFNSFKVGLFFLEGSLVISDLRSETKSSRI